MVKAKLLKQLRKKTDKADKVIDLLACFHETSLLSLEICGVKGGGPAEDTQSASTSCVSRNHNGGLERCQLRFEAAPSSKVLPPTFLEKALVLFETNMGELYRKSSWGLDMESKRDELEHRKARFLFLRRTIMDNTDELVAFVHFRFEMDDEDSPQCVVLYVYEIQVAANFRKQGIGQRLMSLVEHIARFNEMDKVLLTVFKSNNSAMDFYKNRLGYLEDESSPNDEDYVILSKSL